MWWSWKSDGRLDLNDQNLRTIKWHVSFLNNVVRSLLELKRMRKGPGNHYIKNCFPWVSHCLCTHCNLTQPDFEAGYIKEIKKCFGTRACKNQCLVSPMPCLNWDYIFLDMIHWLWHGKHVYLRFNDITKTRFYAVTPNKI